MLKVEVEVGVKVEFKVEVVVMVKVEVEVKVGIGGYLKGSIGVIWVKVKDGAKELVTRLVPKFVLD